MPLVCHEEFLYGLSRLKRPECRKLGWQWGLYTNRAVQPMPAPLCALVFLAGDGRLHFMLDPKLENHFTAMGFAPDVI
jgi:hypothetical protein